MEGGGGSSLAKSGTQKRSERLRGAERLLGCGERDGCVSDGFRV